ncbi:STAS domain-containing protein [Phytohabitans kaempferiae]|uniref:STAS domain-containing protein n=1 Tax=Phytohabitans kaempferiae TaxID=1620943 RepID=A0ABV6M433_9ACTN
MAYDFDLRVELPSGSTARVVVSGEIDMAVADALSASVLGALRTNGVRLVEVELSAVGFIDACGVGVLLAARNDAHRQGKTFLVRGARGLPRRVLEITGVLNALAGKPVEAR